MRGWTLSKGLKERWQNWRLLRRRKTLPEILRLNLVAALEESDAEDGRRPNRYVVKLPRDDFATICQMLPRLRGQLAAAVAAEAEQRKYMLAGPVAVEILPADDRTIRVVSERVPSEPAPSADAESTLTFRPGHSPEREEKPPPRTLVVLRGPDRGSVFSLWGTKTYIGRRETNHVVLHDTGVSRVHAELSWQDGRTRLRDLGSLNGTRVNGEHVTEKNLRSGDQITLGATCLEYQE
ncbi:MAG: DUF3662 domain-containing protein [Firmicutes bacterium]|nr:DUF3662 domain-containing protein [Bacillota bacterium]